MSSSKVPDAIPMVATGFKIKIKDEVYQKIMYWVNKSDHEVSGFGAVTFDKDLKEFTVTDAILIDQENGPTSSEIDPHAYGKAIYEMRDTPNGLKWWWHSHVDMSVFWSGDDMNCIRSIGQQSWMIATVFNKKAQCRSAFYQLTNVMDNKHEVFVDEITTSVVRDDDLSMIESWNAEYKLHVKERRIVHSSRLDFDYGKAWKRPWDIDNQADMLDAYHYMYPDHMKSHGIDRLEETRQKAWAPEPEWDHDGWRQAPGGDYQYNPLRDKAMRDDSERIWKEIMDLDVESLAALIRDDEQFRLYIASEITGQINKRGEIV